MVVIGLTGSICSGKSTVCGFLAELGAAIVSADEIGHRAFLPGTPIWNEVVREFGPEIVGEDGIIDRQKLGAIVFQDKAALSQLNRIMHPGMHRMAAAMIDSLKEKGVEVIVLEAPLLVEANWLDLVDRVWVTTASDQTKVQRCASRSGLSEEQASSRLASQLSDEEKIKHADVVLDTDTTLGEVKERVKALWRDLCSSEDLKQRVTNALSGRTKRTRDLYGPRRGALAPAAVLIPLCQNSGESYIIFTKRNELLNYHSGQISFPGGGWQEGDADMLETALRECWEEIGLQPDAVEVLGELDDMPTYTTNFLITPYVGFIPYPYNFLIRPEEVEEIIEVPLNVLLDARNFREELHPIEGVLVPHYFFDYGSRVIWGATARILKQFLEIVFDARWE